jgi:outer membrane protein assembly factor BamD (BamD/ComL family)
MRTAQAEDAPSTEAEAAPTAESAAGPAAPQTALDLSAVPRDSASQAQMEADRAVARYELANALFLAAGRPDSAATWYRRILQEDGDQSVARRALYALGEAYRAQGDTTAAEQTYQRLAREYPDSPLARRARERLGRPTQAPTENHSARADSAYARAYREWREGAWRPALDGLLGVAQRYPSTEAAPRALLAAGVLYWQRLQADSLRAPRRRLQRRLPALREADSTGADSLGGPLASPRPGGPDRALGLDSLATPTDSGGAPPLGAGSTLDPYAVAADTVAADTVAADSVATPLGSGPVAAPSGPATVPAADALLLWARAGRAAAADSTGLAAFLRPDPHPPLRALLTHLTERYPDAPQVERAETMLSLIDQRTAPSDSTLADSTQPAVPRSDTAAVAAADAATGEAPPPDTTRTAEAPARPRADTAGAGREPLPAPGPPSQGAPSARGGRPQAWTLLVEAFPSATAATSRADALRRRLQDRWPVQAVRDPAADARPHLVVVGRFGSEQAASQVREALQEQLSRRLEVRRMPGGG